MVYCDLNWKKLLLDVSGTITASLLLRLMTRLSTRVHVVARSRLVIEKALKFVAQEGQLSSTDSPTGTIASEGRLGTVTARTFEYALPPAAFQERRR